MAVRLVAILVLLLGANAFAYTHCSDSSGANRYEDNEFRGGPAPRPTTVMDDVKIYMNNELASESTTLYNGTKTEGPLVADLQQNSKTLIDSFTNGYVQDYTIRIAIRNANQSKFPGGGPPPPLFLMLCHQDDVPVP